MMHETSTYYGQPTVSPFSFGQQGGFSNPLGPYGQQLWPLMGGPLAQPQLWNQLGSISPLGIAPHQFGNPLQQYGLLGGWPGPQPHGIGMGSFGNPLQHYAQLAGQGFGSWPGQQQFGGGFGPQFGSLFPPYGQLGAHGIGGGIGYPQLALAAQLARILPALELGPTLIVPTPYGLLPQPIGSPLGGFAGSALGQRGLAGGLLPLQALPQMACAI
jgi:hypothetical protein